MTPGLVATTDCPAPSRPTPFARSIQPSVPKPGMGTPVAASSAHAAQQADGKIVIVGSNYNYNLENFVIARFNTNGRLDNSFGKDGIQFSGIHFR